MEIEENLLPLENVEKIFCINVLENTQRKEFMIRQFDELKIQKNKIVFIEAVTPESEDYQTCLMENKIINTEDKRKKIEQAISLSHRKVWKIIQNENIKIALVVEDDVEFNIEFLKNCSTKVNLGSLTDKKYYVHLLSNYPKKILNCYKETKEPTIIRYNIKYGMGCYFIGNHGSQELSKEENFFPVTKPVDDYMWDRKALAKHRGEFALIPFVCQNSSQPKTICFESNNIFKSNFRN